MRNMIRRTVLLAVVMGSLLAMVGSASAAYRCFVSDTGSTYCGNFPGAPVIPGGPPLPGH